MGDTVIKRDSNFSENEFWLQRQGFSPLVPGVMGIVIDSRANTIMRMLWRGRIFEDDILLIMSPILWTTFKCSKRKQQHKQKPLVLAKEK